MQNGSWDGLEQFPINGSSLRASIYRFWANLYPASGVFAKFTSLKSAVRGVDFCQNMSYVDTSHVKRFVKHVLRIQFEMLLF